MNTAPTEQPTQTPVTPESPTIAPTNLSNSPTTNPTLGESNLHIYLCV